jgi:hypothetical protein
MTLWTKTGTHSSLLLPLQLVEWFLLERLRLPLEFRLPLLYRIQIFKRPLDWPMLHVSLSRLLLLEVAEVGVQRLSSIRPD